MLASVESCALIPAQAVRRLASTETYFLLQDFFHVAANFFSWKLVVSE